MAVILTILGIGLLLFIHETGHFLAARMAGVRIETFSLGFGPRLFGWTKNGCDFRIALIPIGGYVRMAGEDQTRPPLPDELGSKSVAWRFWIFSGGIIANFLFALVVFPVLFLVGVPFPAPVTGQIDPGGPAWEAGLREGERILSVDDREIYSYRQFATAVALSGSDDVLSLEVSSGDGMVRRLDLVPRYDERLGFRRVGVDGPLDPSLEIQVVPGSLAAEAGLLSGDAVVEMDGVTVESAFDLRVLFERAVLQRSPIRLVVEREGRHETATVALDTATEAAAVQVGIRTLVNHVRSVHEPLEGVFQPGDLLLQAGGATVRNTADFLSAAIAAGGMPEVRIRRDGVERTLPARPQVSAEDLAAALWIDAQPVDAEDGLRLAVTPGGAAWEAGLRTGDLLIRVGSEPVDSLAQLIPLVSKSEGLELPFIYRPIAGDEPVEVLVVPKAMPLPNYGFGATIFQETVRSKNILDGIFMGINEARMMVLQVFQTLRRMVTGDLSAENLGGIITIGRLTHRFAGIGWVPLLFFLAIISINLGAINLLPIPALDGGHLFFLLVEKLRGRPLGERAQVWFNVVGFTAVLSLIIFVTFMDIVRWVN